MFLYSCSKYSWRSRITHAVPRRTARVPAARHPQASNAPTTDMGVVKGRRQQENGAGESGSSGVGSQQVSAVTERPPKRSVDPLELGRAKSKNCHRIVALGAPKVGKTNILRRFLGESFEEKYEPTTEDFHRKLFYIGGKAYQMDVLDAATERNFPAKRRLSILTGDTFLLVFSLDDRESFDEVCGLYNEINAAKAAMLKLGNPARVPTIVCGNKADLAAPRAVRRSEVTELLDEDVAYFETSAKDGAGLDDAFRALATLGGLPDETSPSRHQLISILAFQSLCVSQRGRRGSRTPGPGAPCAAMDPLARRPSFNSDLGLVLKSKRDKSERCHIQ